MMHSNADKLVWFDQGIVPASRARIDPFSAMAVYGISAFEGVRCYWNDEHRQLYGFRLKDHVERLLQTALLYGIGVAHTAETIAEVVLETIRANAYREDIRIRPMLLLAGDTWHDRGAGVLAVDAIPSRRRDNADNSGIRCMVSTWQRIGDAAMPPRAKIGANYVNGRLAMLEAKQHGYDAPILRTPEGYIAESAGASVLIVRNGTLVAPPASDCVLEGITVKTLITLAADAPAIPVQVRHIDRTELYLCQEAMLCGTAGEIQAVTSVDTFSVGDGRWGPVSRGLLSRYQRAADGTNPAYRHWLTPVYA